MSLIDKLRKNSTIKEAAVLSESKFFTEKEQIPTDIPMLNVALGGSINGGLGAGLTMIAGPSKHFKSNFALKMVSTFLAKKPNGVVMFYDSEFGSPDSYFKSFGINTDNVLHLPIKNVEELKFDIVKQLEELDKKDDVMILIDSIGNLASKKEIDDALKENAAADMSRAKQLKSLFRMVTPYLTFKDIPMIVINHTYSEISLFPKQIVSGGCVVAGTKIQTLGGLKRIEDFKVGDMVITKYGEQEVSHVWNPETLEDGTPVCYEIEFEDGYIVKCSASHKFIVNGNWVEAKDLITGMNCEMLSS